MSTRCVVSVIDADSTFHVYRHSDGYPESEHGVLATLAQALPYAWPVPRFEADDFAAAIIAAWKTGGGNIRMTTTYEAHGDLEYRYEVRLAGGKLKVKTFTCDYDTGAWKNSGKLHTIG